MMKLALGTVQFSEWTRRLAAEGVELHSRSAFLQGLLLMPEAARPERFSRWSTWQAWASWLGENGLTPLQACLAYALSVEGVDRVVVGADSPACALASPASRRAPGRPASSARRNLRQKKRRHRLGLLPVFRRVDVLDTGSGQDDWLRAGQ